MTATLDTGVHHGAPPEGGLRRPDRWEIVAVVLAMSTVVIIGVIAISRGAPLLWDEAVYSLRVRDLVGEGVRGFYWLEVRAPGLPLLLAPAHLAFGGSDVVLRGASLVFAVAGVGLTWVITRLILGRPYAVVAAWLLVIAPGWHESSWQVMPDIPGTVVTLAAMAVILLAARGERLAWWAVLAAPLAGAATLVRYGAPLLIAPAILAAFLLRWRTVRSSKVWALVVLALTAVAAGVVWFVPQVTGTSGAPVLQFATRQDDKAIPVLASAADLFTHLLELVGPVFGPLVIVGGVVAAVAARRHRELRGPLVACVLIALSVLGLMLFGIAEYHLRYLAPALPFLAIVAAIGLVQIARRLPRRAIVAISAIVGVVGVGVAVDTAVDRTIELQRRYGPTRAGFETIDALTNPPCSVVHRNPAAEWYTGCAILRPADLHRAAVRGWPRPGVPGDEPSFVVIRNGRSPVDLARRQRGQVGGTQTQGALLEQLAVDVIHVSPPVKVLELGAVEDVATALVERGLLQEPEP